MKRIISLLLILVLVLGMIPAQAATAVKITKQPSNATAAEGATATVSFTAEGDGLTYTWYFKNKGASGFSKTSTFTGNTYTAEMNTTRDGRQIYCVVTDKYGNTAQTNTVTLYMGNAIKITKQPANATAAEGATAKVSFTATGDGLTYTWYYKNKGASGFSKTSTFTGNTYTAEMNTTRDGRQVYCVVKDKYGNSVKTNTVTLYMGNAVKITKQPKSVMVASGETAKVSFTATGDGLTYEWYYKNKGASSFTKTTSFTSNTYTLKLDASRDGRQVYCVVTDKYGNSVKTNTATLSIGNVVKITKQPANATAAEGETAKVSFTATGDGLTYEWFYKNKGASTFTKTTTFTGNTYTAEMNATRNGRQVYCVVTDKYGNTAKTNTVTLSLPAQLAITQQPVSTLAAVGTDVSFTVKAEGGTAPLSYKWEISPLGSEFEAIGTDNDWGAIGACSPTLSFEVWDYYEYTDYTYRCVITDADGKSVTTNIVRALCPCVVILTQPVDVAAYYGTNATVSFEACGEGLTYEWFYKNKGAANFTKTTTFTGNTYTAEMNATRDGRQVYCVVTDKYGNSVQTDTVTLNLLTPLKIAKQPADAEAAVGEFATFSVKATGGMEPCTYQWEYHEIGESWKEIKASSSWCNGQQTDTLNVEVEDEGEYGLFQYRCVITDADGNAVTSDHVMVLRPVLQITQQPANATAALGEYATFTVKTRGGVSPMNFQWEFKPIPQTAWIAIGVGADWCTGQNTGKLSVKIADDSEYGNYLYRCVIKDNGGTTVTSDAAMVLRPLIITQQPQNAYAQNGETATVSFTATGDGLTYEWYYKNKGSANFAKTNSFTDSTYTVEMSSARNGRQIYCVVKDKYGNSVQTDTVTLTMGNMLKITKQPVSVRVAEGETARVSFTAEGDGLTYTWYFKNKNSTKFSLTSTFTSNSYSVKMDESRNGRQIYCVVTDKYGNSVQTNTVTLSLPDPVTITQQPADIRTGVGGTATFTVAATGGLEPYTYQWQQNRAGNGWFDLTPDITWCKGSQTDTMYFSVETADEYKEGLYSYRCVITDAKGNSVTSDAACVLPPALKITQQPANYVAQVGETAYFNVAVSGGTAPYTYQWQYAHNGGNWITIPENATWCSGHLTSSFAFEVTDEDEYSIYEYRCVITSADGQSVISNSIRVLRPARPLTISKQPRYTTAGIGETATFTVEATGGEGPYTYQWYFCYGASPWKSIPANTDWCTGQQTSQFSFPVIDDGEYEDEYRYKCVVTDANGNSETSVSVAVIKPLGIASQPQNASGAMGDTVTFTVKPDGGMGPYTYKWEYMAEYGTVWSTMSETSDTLTVDINSTMMVNYYFMYRCTITDTNDNTVTSDIAFLNK